MSPELEQHLYDVGMRLEAQQYLIGLLLGILADREPGLLSANLRACRIRLQEVRGEGRDNPAIAHSIQAMQEALDANPGQPPGPTRT
jgi:hypothetical protein